MPFGKKNEIDYDEIYKEFMKNLSDSSINGNRNIKVHRVDKIYTTSDVDKKMFKAILGADIVVTDLSYLNPNVFYELGIRHSFNKKTTKMIQMEKFKDIPFNINHLQVYLYNHKDINKEIIDCILEKEIEETDSLVHKNIKELIDVSKEKYSNVFNKFNIYDDKYKEIKDKIEEYKKNNMWKEGLKYIYKNELYFFPNSPLYLERILFTYKIKENSEIDLLKAKKMIDNLEEIIKNTSEAKGLNVSISNRLLKIGKIDDQEALDISDLYFAEEKSPYSYGTHIMNKVYLSLNGFMKKEEVKLIAQRLETSFLEVKESESYDGRSDEKYYNDTLLLIRSINSEIDESQIKEVTTKNNYYEIKDWKNKK